MSLNKAELVTAVAEATGETKVLSEKMILATVNAISAELGKGENVTLIGFGTFSVYGRAARTGKNPRTGASIKISAKKVAKFKPGKALSALVNPVVVEAPKKKAAKKK
jgi:DNA-binding protein HU-beta